MQRKNSVMIYLTIVYFSMALLILACLSILPFAAATVYVVSVENTPTPTQTIVPTATPIPTVVPIEYPTQPQPCEQTVIFFFNLFINDCE